MYMKLRIIAIEYCLVANMVGMLLKYIFKLTIKSSAIPARTCTLIILCTALGGAWTLEQPSGSLLEFYPTWRFILGAICKCGGPFAAMTLNTLSDEIEMCT